MSDSLDDAFLALQREYLAELPVRLDEPAVGNQVLLHVANVFRSSVRASELIGRHAGERFGMILREGGAEGAAVLAAKLRRVLGEQAATTAEGVIMPLHASVGWASFPADGASAAEWPMPPAGHCGRRSWKSSKE